MYTLFDFVFLETKIENALTKLLIGNPIVHSDHVVNEIGKPWPEIKAVTYKIAKKLGLTILNDKGQTTFVRMNENIA